MEAEILRRRPLSGEYEEHGFDAFGNTLWVKFMGSEYVEWCGVFGLGCKRGQSHVQVQANSGRGYVLAGGRFYALDINSRRLIAKSKDDDLDEFVIHRASGYVVATDGLRVLLFEGGKVRLPSDRVSLDGLVFSGQKGDEIYGKLNDCPDEWADFTFNVRTRE